MTEAEVYEAAARAWGYKAQADMAIEEMAELTVALCHFDRASKGPSSEAISAIREEIADVQIMMEQMSRFFGKDAVHEIRRTKLHRLRERLQQTTDFSVAPKREAL